jgi:tetratricopeptide (TPR) repeat protein
MRYVVAIAALLALSASAAGGDDGSMARDHHLKGTRAYELGLYDEAIAEYMAAYKAKDDPALLFNLGQAHRLAGHAAEALRFYKTYLSKVPEAANRADVESRIRELKELVEKQKQAQAEPAAVSGASNGPAVTGPTTPGPVLAATSVPTDVGAGSPAAVTVQGPPPIERSLVRARSWRGSWRGPAALPWWARASLSACSRSKPATSSRSSTRTGAYSTRRRKARAGGTKCSRAFF